MKNKVALVTGATGGIGRAAAIAFARKGARVVVVGRRETQGQETVGLVSEAGSEAIFVQADVSKREDCERMVSETMARFERLDFAFNNAGIEGGMAPIVEESEENFHRVMNTNVLGVMLSMQFQIPAMIKSGGGAIVNNASVAAIIGMPGISTYSASKHAVLGLTKVASLEVAKQNIRVNSVSPAAVKTEMLSRFTGNNAEAEAQLAQLHPMGRAGTPEEIANAVTFLCSTDSSFITGTNLVLDGGFTIQ